MSDPVEVARDFITEEFPVTDSQKQIAEHVDVVILMGSAVHECLPEPNDLDIAVHVPLRIEESLDVPPVHRSLEFRGYDVELCMIATERLERAARRNDGLWYYWEAEVLWAGNDRYHELVETAAEVTEVEKRSILITEYANFDINGFKSEHAPETDLTIDIFESQRLLNYVQAKLAANDVHLAYKWMGEKLREIDREAYERAKERDWDYLRTDLQRILRDHGFSQKEIESWDRHNLEMLRFQRN